MVDPHRYHCLHSYPGTSLKSHPPFFLFSLFSFSLFRLFPVRLPAPPPGQPPPHPTPNPPSGDIVVYSLGQVYVVSLMQILICFVDWKGECTCEVVWGSMYVGRGMIVGLYPTQA